MGRHPDIATLVERVAAELAQPLVLDADALHPGTRGDGKLRVMTPHPGEMARLTGKSTADVQKDRVAVAREYATAHGATYVELRGGHFALLLDREHAMSALTGWLARR